MSTDSATSRENLRTFVRGSYDLQRLRIQTGNRIVTNFRAKLGQKPSEKEESMDEDAKDVLEDLRLRYRKLTDGVKDFPAKSQFKGDAVISSYTELCLLSQYIDLEKNENQHFRRLSSMLEEFPIYTTFLRDVKGVGPQMAGIIISEIDITKAKYASSLIKLAGLDVVLPVNNDVVIEEMVTKYKEKVTEAYDSAVGLAQTVKDVNRKSLEQFSTFANIAFGGIFNELAQAVCTAKNFEETSIKDQFIQFYIQGRANELIEFFLTQKQVKLNTADLAENVIRIFVRGILSKLNALINGTEVEVGEGRSRKKHHLVKRKYIDKHGKEQERDSVTFKPWLKTKLVGVLGDVFIKVPGNDYRPIYDAYKARLENNPRHVTWARVSGSCPLPELINDIWLRKVKAVGTKKTESVEYLYQKPLDKRGWTEQALPKEAQYVPDTDKKYFYVADKNGNEIARYRYGKSKGHRHNMAVRYMIRAFLCRLYSEWRTLENLPVHRPYEEAKLGLYHGRDEAEVA